MSDDAKIPKDPISEFVTIPRGYINSVKVGHGLYEFQIILSNTVVNNLDKNPATIMVPQYIAQVSPQHFKVITSLFSDQLKKYEAKFGEIQVPEDALKIK